MHIITFRRPTWRVGIGQLCVFMINVIYAGVLAKVTGKETVSLIKKLTTFKLLFVLNQTTTMNGGHRDNI